MIWGPCYLKLRSQCSLVTQNTLTQLKPQNIQWIRENAKPATTEKNLCAGSMSAHWVGYICKTCLKPCNLNLRSGQIRVQVLPPPQLHCLCVPLNNANGLRVCGITVPGRDVQQGTILPSWSHPVVSLPLWLSLYQLQGSAESVYQNMITEWSVWACSDNDPTSV